MPAGTMPSGVPDPDSASATARTVPSPPATTPGRRSRRAPRPYDPDRDRPRWSRATARRTSRPVSRIAVARSRNCGLTLTGLKITAQRRGSGDTCASVADWSACRTRSSDYTLADLVGRQTLKWQAVPAGRAAALGRRDGHRPGRAGPRRDHQRGAPRRGRLPLGARLPEALASYAADAWDWSLDPDAVRHTADVMTGMAHAVRLVTAVGRRAGADDPGLPALPRPRRESPVARSVTRPGRAGDSTSTPWTAAFAAIRADGRAAYLRCATRTTRPGTVHSPAELAALAALAEEHGVRVVADEIHAPVVYAGGHGSRPYLTVPGAERGFSVFSPSKGWNLRRPEVGPGVAGPGAVDDFRRLHEAEHARLVAPSGRSPTSAAMADGRDWLASSWSASSTPTGPCSGGCSPSTCPACGGGRRRRPTSPGWTAATSGSATTRRGSSASAGGSPLGSAPELRPRAGAGSPGSTSPPHRRC